MDKKYENWDKIITVKQNSLNHQMKRVWEYRDLVLLLVKRDFITYYKQTVLGPLWYLFQPICSTIMYMVVFGTLAKIGTDSIPQPLFYFSGAMLWTYFSDVLLQISNVFYRNKDLFGKVFFPRLVVPIATSVSSLIKLGIQFVLFVGIYLFYAFMQVDIAPSRCFVLFPMVILWIGIIACGIGMIISSVTTKYRDLAMVLEFVISLCMYITPVTYPLSEVPANMIVFFYLNPVSAPIELFRYCFFGTSTVSTNGILLSIFMTILFLFWGIKLFGKNERTFIDVI